MTTQIHKTAILDQGISIGDGTRVWHWVHICSGAIIGQHCSLGQNVFISGDVVIGNNVKIQNNVSIYDRVVIENDVFCGPSMVFTNVFNPRAAIPRKDQYKKTTVRQGATIGANATIVCGIEIGEYSFIGAGAVVTHDVKPFALVVGNPAVQKGWMSRYGEKIDLPIKGDGEFICPFTKDHYLLTNGMMLCVDMIDT